MNATSWGEKCVKHIEDIGSASKVIADQCQYGAEAYGQPIRKPTSFMSNSEELRKALPEVCKGTLGHCSRAG